MSAQKLISIALPKEETISWGGVPLYMISTLFNSQMNGFSISAVEYRFCTEMPTISNDLHQIKSDTIPGTDAGKCNITAQLCVYVMERVNGAPSQIVLKKQSVRQLNQKFHLLMEGKLPETFIITSL